MDEDQNSDDSIMDQMFEAARTKDLDRLKELLESGDKSPENILRDNFAEALLLEVYYDEDIDEDTLEIVKYLIKAGVDINATDMNGDTALSLTLERSDNDAYNNIAIKIIKELIKAGADVNITNGDGDSPVDIAAMYSVVSNEPLKLLLEAGADPYNALGHCQIFDCKQLISSYIWSRMEQNINKLANQYSRSGDFPLPREIWKLILLRKRQKQLCRYAVSYTHLTLPTTPYV